VTDWDDLKEIIAELRAQQPSPLTRFPDPSAGELSPPFAIGLAAWAEPVARRLHDRFADKVQLTVGALRYPSREPPRPSRSARGEPPADPLDPAEISVALDDPAVVRSGHILRHGLLVTNHLRTEIALATNGTITASVIDPESGEVAGGYSGFQTLPLKLFRIAPGATERVPLLIGTTSYTPELGYAIPPGTWALQVILTLTSPDIALAVRDKIQIRKQAPPLPLTITG
jgi:hypothetical protein